MQPFSHQQTGGRQSELFKFQQIVTCHIISARNDLESKLQPWTRKLAELWDACNSAHRRLPTPFSPSYLPFASISSQVHTRTSPAFDLAMVKDEVKYRLAPIPVYTVANENNDLVLVTGENDGESTKLGLFFFNAADAEAMMASIREQQPRMARSMKPKVLTTSMDAIYEIFTTPREETGLQGVHFRFMPDMKQVHHAVDLFDKAGLATDSFLGVPVFQADGLTVTSKSNQYVPLFLCKEDLELAVDAAYKSRNQAQIALYREKADKYKEELARVNAEAENTADERRKMLLEQQALKAEDKWKVAEQKAADVERAPLPQIEVGSLEEVMMRLTTAEGPDLQAWSQVTFVTPGILSSSNDSKQA